MSYALESMEAKNFSIVEIIFKDFYFQYQLSKDF